MSRELGECQLKLSKLKEIHSNERALLSNARCLSEGVDVPTLDGVAFIDPKGSQADIIQAVGRAIRLSPNKEKGTIILPVFIEGGSSQEITPDTSRFKPIWDVLNALKAHDDILSNELDQLRVGLGRHSGGAFKIRGFSKIEIDLPISVSHSFVDSIRTVLIESVTDSWEFWYGLLLKYVDENGTSQVPVIYKTIDHYPLGDWLNKQRRLKDKLSHIRKSRLELLSKWTWSVLDSKWEQGFNYLLEFSKKNGGCAVPSHFITEDGYPLGGWVSKQRQAKDQLTLNRKALLESIKGWSWSRFDELWMEAFNHLKIYVSKNGHCLVPKETTLENGYKLGEWVGAQRRNYKKLSVERITLLESVDGWVWNSKESKWDLGLNLVKKYSHEKGNCLIPISFKSENGFPLGSWVRNQRVAKDKLSHYRKQELEKISGWVWKVKD